MSDFGDSHLLPASDHGDTGSKGSSPTQNARERKAGSRAPSHHDLQPCTSLPTAAVTRKEIRSGGPSPRPGFWKGPTSQHPAFSDTSITSCDGVNFPTNRLVLATASPYFQALFTTELGKDVYNSDLEIESGVLRTVLEFAYTGTCPLDSTSVQILLPIADKYGFQGLADHCCSYIKSQLEPSNSIGVLNFTKPYFCPQFNSELRLYILRNFREVIRARSEFVRLDAQDLQSFLQDDYLNLLSEAEVYQGLVTWLEYKYKERFPKLLNLLKTVRYGLMSQDYFLNVVCQSTYCQDSEVSFEF
jgi:hypothetical protein